MSQKQSRLKELMDDVSAAAKLLVGIGYTHAQAVEFAKRDDIEIAAEEDEITITEFISKMIRDGDIEPPTDEAPQGAILAVAMDGVQSLGGGSLVNQPSPAHDAAKISALCLWKDKHKEKLKPNSLHNILVYLRHDERYHGLFRYDRFARQVVLHKEPFWHRGEPFKVRRRCDTDISYIEAVMDANGLDASSNKIREAVDVVAHENWINPPLDYFESLKWDGRPRLGKWLSYYLGADGDPDYLQAVGMAWLIAGVARIYDPGCKAENMLVLEGEQGLLKSTALACLANVGQGKDQESYFCDTLTFSKIHEKDTVSILQGKMIVEFAELASLGSREIEEVKGWMSIQYDEIRKPYGHDVEKYPRQFILAGTTNENHWLKDQTGNRRFWPVKCVNIDIKALTNDRAQLWAEAVHLYKSKADWWISKSSPVWIKAMDEQDFRLIEDIWSDPIEHFVRGMSFVTVKEILTNFKIDEKDQNRQHQARVTSVLRRLGYSNVIKRTGTKTSRGWSKETKQEEIPIDNI